MVFKKILMVVSVFLAHSLFSQIGSSPWLAPLRVCTSTNGTSFGSSSVFQDSSGVPSVIRIGTNASDTLACVFQWFPMPFGTSNPKWDKVAVKFSYNGGTTWTSPQVCNFIGLPAGFQRPFDPTLVKMPNGQIRMYFSTNALPTVAAGIDTYSGLSNDGITYTVDPGARFNDLTKHSIDPAVALFNGNYYFTSWSTVVADGAHRAISSDALTFTTQAVTPYDGVHQWLGNYLPDGTNLKFYGCGPSGMWLNSSPTGTTWGAFTSISVMGADPSVVKNKNGTYVMVYTGPPSTNNLNELNTQSAYLLYPTQFRDVVFLRRNSNTETMKVAIYTISGHLVFSKTLENEAHDSSIELHHLCEGVYYCSISTAKETATQKIVKLR